MSTLLITFENCIKLLGCRASKFAKCKIISPLFNKTFPTDHCDDNFLRPQKSPNYLSIPAAVKLLNDERQLTLNDRKDFGIPVLAVVLVHVSGLASIALVPLREILGAGAVYLHYLNRSRKQYILYEIACIHQHKFPYATWINFSSSSSSSNSSSSIIYLRRD
ncbi:hypothetical protein T05_10869 [Trichinella murrelli]|uniref:Uncharacterized protein n=1 Tax=Trichinella murrelli TaxID=144512 RepID=A0A0V0U5Q5_9BILA|nr:hypothetical protein T05_10869 [Trichinella murrelli]